MSRQLQVILKTAERCNINCSYCYFFNGADQSYKQHPPYVQKTMIEQLVRFLKEGCADDQRDHIQIIFHGGEPLMQKTADFDAMCDEIRSGLGSVKVDLCLQTNAMLVSETWIDLFEKYGVHVGVSLDGKKVHHDVYRIDRRGKGTYDRTLKGVQKLQEAASLRRIPPLSALCVINPANSAREIYRHFIDDLRIHCVDFLLPNFNHDTMHESEYSPQAYGLYVSELFDEWTSDDNPRVRIKILNNALALFGAGAVYQGADVISISSHGEIGPDDNFKSCHPRFLNTQLTLGKASLKEVFSSPVFQELLFQERQVPADCQVCPWLKLCHGGLLYHRYSSRNGFDNASVMCEGLKIFYSQVAAFAFSHGIPADRLAAIFPQGVQAC